MRGIPSLAALAMAALHPLAAPMSAQAPAPPAPAPAAPAPAPPRPTCDAPEHRQFDFWIGDWEVTVSGRPAGTNRITREESGCLLVEHWTGAGGGTGQSYNFYDRQDRKWHQVWVDNAGSVLRLSGEYRDRQLRYAGTTRTRAGGALLHRLTFTWNEDGTVRQFWENSTDDGATWTVAFDGRYRRRAGR